MGLVDGQAGQIDLHLLLRSLLLREEMYQGQQGDHHGKAHDILALCGYLDLTNLIEYF